MKGTGRRVICFQGAGEHLDQLVNCHSAHFGISFHFPDMERFNGIGLPLTNIFRDLGASKILGGFRKQGVAVKHFRELGRSF